MRDSFTAELPAENKRGIIEQINKYTNMRCEAKYHTFDTMDEMRVDLVDSVGELLATLMFSDRGVRIKSLPNKKLKIDIHGLDSLWKDELIENYGSYYERSLNRNSNKDSNISTEI